MRRRNRKRWKKAPIAASKEEKCFTKYCRNKKVFGKDGYFRKYCHKCLSRQCKEKRPWTYVLNMLRHSARKRNLPFTLTVESFKKWCEETGYLAGRGNKPEDLTIDRIDWNEGYHIANLRVLTHAQNSKQGADNTRRDERMADSDEPIYSSKLPPVSETEPF